MLEPVVFVGVGLGLLIFGGELLVRSASKIAMALGISPLVIGLTIVAYGTSAPELGVSLFAALQGKPEIAFSNVVGSNIFNICFILGLCGIISPLVVNLQLIKLDVPILILVSLLTYVFSYDGVLSQTEGIVFVFGAVVYTVWLIRASKNESELVEQEFTSAVKTRKNKDGLFVQSLFILAALVVLVAGSKLLVSGATDFAKLMGVSDTLIGLTIVAAGTSLPEVATSVMATIRGQKDIAIGNVIGSNIFNLMLILGLSAGVNSGGLKVESTMIQFDIPVMIGVALVCLPLLMTSRKLVRWEGLLLLVIYIVYTVFLWKRG